MHFKVLFFSFVLMWQLPVYESRFDSVITLIKERRIDDSVKVKLLYEAGYYGKKERLENFDLYYRQGYELARKIDYPNKNASFLNELGRVESDKADYEKALEYFFQALNEKEIDNDPIVKAYIYNNLAIVYADLKNQPLSYEYQEKSIGIRKEFGTPKEVAIALFNFSNNLRRNTELERAISTAKEALELFTQVDDLKGMALSSNSIGNSLADLKHYEEAIQYYESANNLFTKGGNDIGKVGTRLNIGTCLLELGELPIAEFHLLKALDEGKELNDFNILMEVNENLNRLYEQLNDYEKALQYYKDFSMLKDSVAKVNQNEALERLRIEHETSDKEKKIKELEQQLSSEALKSNIYLGGLVVMSILVGILWNRRKNVEQ